MLDAKIASALKMMITSVHFRMRVSVEEQRSQHTTGSYEEGRLLSKLYKVYQIYSVYAYRMMTFKTLSSASEIPTETVLEILYKLKIRESVQLQTVLAMYEQEIARNNEPPNSY